MGDEGLGYYLDDKQLAKERALEGLEGPGIPQTAPVAAADSDDERDAAPAAPSRAAIIAAADLPSPRRGPRRPSTLRGPAAARGKAPPKPKAARRAAAAATRARQGLARASSSSKDLFKELAKAQSDCGSAKKGGDLGFFRRGKMSPPFEVAAFNLDVGELAKTVASSSGVHLIYRVA
ncbi:hypothetical protein JL721_1614 [Aureococcus anophagefferens]|nr:hypothetical protein JL721_1614 [Aureococcus anophagefferens]